MNTFYLPVLFLSISLAITLAVGFLYWNRKLQQQASRRTLDIAKLLQDYKNLAQALRKSQAQLNAIVNHLPCDLWVFDNNGSCVLQNSSSTRRWGHQTQISISDLNLPQPLLGEFEHGQRSAMEGDAIEKELFLNNPKHPQSFLYKTAPVQSNNKIYGSVMINIDTSELKHAQHKLKQETSFSRLFMDNLPALFYLFNLDGSLLKWNANFERVSGFNPDQLKTVRIYDLFNDNDIDRIHERIRLIHTTGFAALEANLQTKDGREIPFYFTGTLIDHHGETCILGCAIDISERKKAENALSFSEERFRLAFESAPIGMALVDIKGRFLQVNGQLCRILGYKEAEFKSIRLRDLEKEPNTQAGRLNESTLHSKIFHSEKKLIHKNDHNVWVQFSSVLVHDTANNSQYYVVQIADITERKELVAKLHKLAFHDALTGLPNRKLFTEFLDKALAKSSREPEALIALIFIDLDRFKRVNDSLGHLVGDQLLKAVADRLQKQLRPTDIIARFAGDEFVVLLDNVTTQEEAVELALRLQKSLNPTFDISGHALSCGASMGLSVTPAVACTAEVLLRDADTAMYQAKEQGRGRVVLFNQTMHMQAKSRLDMENSIRQALFEQSFIIHFQPIVSMSTGRIISLEALSRWPSKENPQNLKQPHEFLPIAEESGLLIEHDRYILEQGLLQLSKWQASLPKQSAPLGLNVNFTSHQILAPDFIEYIETLLIKYEIRPQSLNIEITESALLDDNEQTQIQLEALKKLSVNIHLDDFGTGYSALSYLYKFPIDTIKIDKAFIKRMLKSEKHLAIVKSIILLAKTQHISVIAEGIEMQAQFNKLRSLQCSSGQGFLISKPKAAKELTHLLMEDHCWVEEAEFA